MAGRIRIVGRRPHDAAVAGQRLLCAGAYGAAHSASAAAMSAKQSRRRFRDRPTRAGETSVNGGAVDLVSRRTPIA